MSEPVTKPFEDWKAGDRASFDVMITDELIARFAELSGDTNPIHVDEAFACETPFQGRIAHGMLVASFFSRLVGMHLPGRGCVYLTQSLRFKQPARIGMTVRVDGAIEDIQAATRVLRIRMTATDIAAGTVLVEGEALVQVMDV